MRLVRWHVLLAGLALLSVSCAGSLGSGGDNDPKKPVKIGVVTGLTGAYVQLGQGQQNGAKLAAEVLRNRVGDRPLQVIVRDDQLKPEAALREAQSLVQGDHVDFLTGCVSAATTLAINQVAKEAGVPYLGTCQTEQLNRPPNFSSGTYHLAPATSMNINAAVPWICQNLGKSIYLLEPDYAWGHEQHTAYEVAIKAAGCKVAGVDWFPLGTTDFSPYIPKVQGSKANVVVFGGAGRDQVNFLRQANQFGLKDKFKLFFNLEDLSFDEELGSDAVEGTYAMAHFYWNVPDPGVREFVAAYQKRFGQPPGGYAVLLYNAVRLIADQVAKGNDDSAKFGKAAADLKFSYGQGPEVLRACDHQALAPVYIMQGLSQKEAASRGGSAQHGFRAVVKTVPASANYAPTCQEVKQKFTPARS